MPTTVFCGNIPFESGPEEVLELFKPFGEISEHKTVKTYLFVDFAKEEDAKKAAEALHKHSIKGRELTVQISKKKEGASRREGSDRDRRDGSRDGRRGGDRDRRDNRRDDRDRRAPYNRVGGHPGDGILGDPMSILGALTGQLGGMNPLGGGGFGGAMPITDPCVVYERYFLEPNHPLLQGLPLPKYPNFHGR